MNQTGRMRTSNIVFGKVHLEPSIFSIGHEPLELAETLFSSTIRTVHKTERAEAKAHWVISNNRIVNFEGDKYVVGRLGRISRKWVKVFDERLFSEAQTEVPTAFVAASHFALNLA